MNFRVEGANGIPVLLITGDKQNIWAVHLLFLIFNCNSLYQKGAPVAQPETNTTPAIVFI